MRAVFAVLSAALVLSGCGGGSSVPQGSSLSASATTNGAPTTAGASASGTASGTLKPRAFFLPNYAAIGASDAVGIGASIPCGLLHSILPGCPGGTSYAPILSRDVYGALGSLYLRDLGISAAVTGPDIRTLVNQYGSASYDKCKPRILLDVVPADFISNEIPKFPGNTNQVTIFAGANDVNGLVNALGCGAGGTTQQAQAAFLQNETSAFQGDLQQLVSAVEHNAPTAKIAIANLPNLALLPFAKPDSDSVKFALQSFVLAFDTVIDALPSPSSPVRIVDLLCNDASYAKLNYSSDGYHPDDAGYAAFAELFETALTKPAQLPPSPSSCPKYSNALSSTVQPMREPFLNPEAPTTQ